MKFYDRERELAILRGNEEASKKHASFTVVVGRRRVGKTTLLNKAFEGRKCVYFFVSRDSEALLCAKLQREIELQLGIQIYGTITLFSQLFEFIMKFSIREHFTLIIDEFQELYRINQAIFSQIQDIWDRYHNESKINLVVCGSVRSLMRRIFEFDSEPLYGRPTSRLTLRPFETKTLKQIISEANTEYAPDDLLCLYAITGGVPKYVELLIDSGSVTREKMLDYVCRLDSYFITEGREIISSEFQGEYGTYFSILQLIAAGKTRRAEIDGAIGKDMGVHLANLEKNYEMVTRLTPILAKPGTKTAAYEISDAFLRFWFRFIYPCQSLVERQKMDIMRKFIEENYNTFTGRTLERFFQDKIMETGKYTRIGNWWNRRGENEIDLVALNEFDYTGLIAEVKRNPAKINLSELKAKAAKLPPEEFGKYSFSFLNLSLNDV